MDPVSYINYVTVGNMFFPLGDLSSYISAILAIGTLLLALFVALSQSRINKRKEITSQGEKVSAWIETESYDLNRTCIALLNQSNTPIYNVIVSIVNLRTNAGQLKGEFPTEFQALIGILPPGKSYSFVKYGYRGMHFTPAVEIVFRDAANNTWIRKGNGILQQLHISPLEYYGFLEPVGWGTAVNTTGI